LADEIRRRYLRVWFHERELPDSLPKEAAIKDSDYAALILTPAYLAEPWSKEEVDALVASESETGSPKLLAVWQSVNQSQVRGLNSILGDRVALESNGDPMRTAGEIARVIRQQRQSPKTRVRSLLLLPFSADFAAQREAVFGALQEAGVDVIRMGDMSAGAFWVERIRQAVRDADFVIADVTGANPNILYELGMAEALQKPVVLLQDSQSETRLPSDLAGYSWIRYERGNLGTLTHSVGNVARRYTGTVAAQL
jgi:hypothetical protein